MSKPIECPNCGYKFDYDEARVTEQQQMLAVLKAHGFSLRSMGRLMSLHPESVKYRLEKAKKGRKV